MSDTQNVEQEVRFAIVLYGGVSLAIYINGVVQEIRNLIRATSGMPLSTDEASGPIPVYQTLASILERGKIPTGELSATDGRNRPIRTRFKVDIISGTSAGGINGIFLAKSLANNASMTSLQDLWFNEGAIESLLNDKKSYTDTNLNQPRETESLLNSRRMYLKLLNAFDGMDSTNRSAVSHGSTVSPLADEIDLFATTTDIEGIPVPIQLFDNVVYERRYRNAYHLRFAGGEQNDFQADNNPFLAFAARCTSSFPFAFEPMQLCSMDDILAHSSIYAGKKYCLSNSTRWQKYYTNYLHGVLPGSTPFPKRAFGDGGYLNNAPFSFAVDTLVQRQSEVPMDRKLIYVEPSPDHPEEASCHPDPPNAIENSIDALVVIPGYQTIRNDLVRVLERNRAVTKINKTLAEAEQEIENQAKSKPDIEQNPREIWFSGGVSSRAYYRMRSSEITDLIAQMVARLRSIDEDSAYFLALRSLIRAWRERVFAIDPKTRSATGGKPGEQQAADRLTDFLADFDLPYRLRRLRFVARKLDGLYALKLDNENPAYSDALTTLRFGLNDPDPRGELPEGLPEVRARVGQQYRKLKQLLDSLLRVPDPEDKDTPSVPGAGPSTLGRGYVGSTLPERPLILQVLERVLHIRGSDAPTDGKHQPLYATEATVRKSSEPGDLEVLCDLRARDLLASDDQLLKELEQLGEALHVRLQGVLEKVHAEMIGSFQDQRAGRIARRLYLYFDLFDAVQYPMMFGTDVVASDTVEIIRIAPEDAARLTPDLHERRQKLKGLAVAHFGAFLDRDWRVSDLLWGRLDAAERLITALLPWEDSQQIRNQLIDQAHSAIFDDFQVQTKLKDMATRQVVAQGPENRLSAASVQKLVDVVTPATAPATLEGHRELMEVWQDVVPAAMNRRSEVETLARSTTIIGKILENISSQRNLPLKASWLTNAGRAFWGIVEISVPRSAFRLLGTYWQSLLFLISAILIIAGFLSSGVAGVGWSLFALASLLFTLRTILGSYMRGGGALRTIAGVLVLVLLLLLGVGVWQTHQWIVDLTSVSPMSLLRGIMGECPQGAVPK
jgi:patatin-related protein